MPPYYWYWYIGIRICFALCFVILTLYVIGPNRLQRQQKDTFAASQKQKSKTPSSVVYTPNMLNDVDWIGKSKQPLGNVNYRSVSDSTSLITLYKVIAEGKSDTLRTSEKVVPDKVLAVIDPYDLEKYGFGNNKNVKTVATSPRGYFMAIGTTHSVYNMECSFNLGGTVKSIGYTSQTDYNFINALLNAYRVDKSGVTFTLLTSTDLSALPKTLKDNKIDIVFAFVILNSPLHGILRTQNIAFMGFKDLDVDRVKLFYPTFTMATVNMRKLLLSKAGSIASVPDKENSTMLPSMSLNLVQISVANDNDNNKKESFITQVSLSPQSLDPTYRCYGDLNIKSKALCDSPYDMIGDPKPRATTWDQPCLKDADCPFFQANKNYGNNRGGCLDRGVCELPIGVRRVSYRKYDAVGEFSPFCYGCSAYDADCCAKQPKPDYAFPNDKVARSAARLPTSIPMS